MDADNWVTVKPNRALYAQEVEISCFKERLRLLASNGIDVTGLEHLEMSGEVGANNYLPIATYTSGFGYEVNTMNIDSSAKLNKESNYHFPSLTLTTIAYHLHNFHGFRCRMKFRNEQIPEYEVVNSGSVCFMRQPPPIEMTVDNISVPMVEDTTQESIPQNRNLQIFQTSCVKPETRLVFTCSQWREMETCDDAHTVDSVYNVDTDLIIYNAKRLEYVIKKPVFDRLGRGRVDIPTVPHEWHTAEVVCHRTIRRTDNISHIILDQYSSAVRICVSQTTFTFYLAHTGFEWSTGLTMSLDDMINMGAVTKMEMGDEMNDVDVGSAVICQVTGDGGRVNETIIKQRNVEPENDIETVRIVGYENASIAMLMNADVDKKITFLALFCQTKRLESQIIERSEVLWLAVHEAVLKDEGFKEVNDLILYILLTVCASLLIAVSCPLIARLSQRRQNRQRARYRKAVARRLKRLNYLREIGMHKVDVNGEFARELSPKTNIFTREHGKKDFKGKDFGPPPAASQNAVQITNTIHV
ncbi:unnamed protein product [Hydatigera taeniaeformis]|uniref:Ig-like domain-containing protein n=1 Tax=Hydatigena taeniaeformis TaxID=6205 RepID=A0A0R3WS43_HYDTA|nr:unnamed protein product [Hydatigera taeniaeformis]